MSEPLSILAIDPSLYNCGWALYRGLAPIGIDYHDLDDRKWQWGLINPEGATIVEKWRDVVAKLEFVVDEPIDFLVCEYPQFFASTRGRIAAMKGDTLNLAGLVGHITCRFGTQVVLWTPTEWKGSVPKRITLQRFKRYFGASGGIVVSTGSDDVIDALMLAEEFLTRWLKDHQKGGES